MPKASQISICVFALFLSACSKPDASSEPRKQPAVEGEPSASVVNASSLEGSEPLAPGSQVVTLDVDFAPPFTFDELTPSEPIELDVDFAPPATFD